MNEIGSKIDVESQLERIRAVVRNVVFDKEMHDDVVQECCVRLIEKEHLWSGRPSSLSGWVNTLARNVSLDFLRKKKTEPLRTEISEDFPDDNREISEDQIRYVLENFYRLSNSQRDVLHMKYYQNMTTVEIAGKLGISQQAASKRVRTAISLLQKRAKIDGMIPLSILFVVTSIAFINNNIHSKRPQETPSIIKPDPSFAMPDKLEIQKGETGIVNRKILLRNEKKLMVIDFDETGEIVLLTVWNDGGLPVVVFSKDESLDIRDQYRDQIKNWTDWMNEVESR